jgi:hypothetical protein
MNTHYFIVLIMSYPMRNFVRLFYFTAVTILFCLSCTSTEKVFNPDKKYTPDQLKQDYTLFRNILEESHPGLYWYTSKDSMDYYFDRGYRLIRDSLTETQFRILLSYVITKINCGHTSVHYSKKFSKYLDTAQLKLFPLTLKFWEDTMIVTSNINRRDSILKQGTVLVSINGLTQPQLRDSLFNYQVTDGYSMTGKYQSLSTGFNFGVSTSAPGIKTFMGYQKNLISTTETLWALNNKLLFLPMTRLQILSGITTTA